MDNITHALVGVTIAQAGFRGRLGRSALGWGAVMQLLPDIDMLAATRYGRYGEWAYHRGFTHSFWFGPLVGAGAGYAIWKWHQRRRRTEVGNPAPGAPEAMLWWIALCVLCLFLHPVLDIFTPYGTQFFMPFSYRRVSLNAVGIVDIVFSGVLLGGAIWMFAFSRRREVCRNIAWFVLAFCATYLGYGWWLNGQAEREAARQLKQEGVTVNTVRAYPTLLQPYYRRVVAHSGNTIYVAHFTSWTPTTIKWSSFENDTSAMAISTEQTDLGALLVWFAQEEVAAKLLPNGAGYRVELDDLRYGFPERPAEGFWGVSQDFTLAGTPTGPPKFMDRHPPRDVGLLLGELWHNTFHND